MKTSTMTTYVTTLRLTTAQARKIRGLAHGEGLSMAQWLRRAVSEKLEREVPPGDWAEQRERAMSKDVTK